MRIVLTDTAELHALAGALIREYGERYEFDFTDADWLAEIADPAVKYAAPDGAMLVAFMDEEPSGVVALRRANGTACEMKRMYVRPAFRRRGIGRGLALELLRIARERGYATMILDTPDDNVRAIEMYRSIGFTEFTPTDPEPGWTNMRATVSVDAATRG